MPQYLAIKFLFFGAFACLLFLAYIALLQISGTKKKNIDTEIRIHVLERKLRDTTGLEVIQTRLVINNLENFYKLSEIASKLQELADRTGLVLSETSYKPIRDLANIHVGGVKIDVRLRGNYIGLKSVSAELLASNVGLVMDSIDLRLPSSSRLQLACGIY